MNSKKLRNSSTVLKNPFELFDLLINTFKGASKHALQCLMATVIVLGFSFGDALAQSHEVSGVVTDQNTGETLPGVNILVVGSDFGTTTNIDGEFSLTLPSPNESLRFTFIGYQQQIVPVEGRSTINVELTPGVISGDELIVVGYSVQQRRDMTGSISVVNMEDFETQAVSGDFITKGLQGQASGVTVVSSGQPGESPNIRIRGINTFGNNNPLYVVDGVPTENINDLNSRDVESIQVLKDASAASIYGARAANGVIVITTKKGGGTVQVNYSGTYGVDWQGRDNPFDIASPQGHADLLWMAQANSGIPQGNSLYGSGSQPVLPDFIAPVGAMEGEVNMDEYFVIPEYNDGSLLSDFVRITRANKEGTDWFNEIFQTANTNQHDISVNGGSELGNFLFSVNYLNQEGTLMRTFRERVTLRANTSFNIGERFRVGENLSYSVSESPQVASLTEGSAIGMAYRQQPIIPVQDVMGNFAGGFGAPLGNANNPVAMQDRTRNNESESRRLFGNIFAEVDVLDNVMLRTSFGGELWSNEFKSFQFPTYENAENSPVNQFNTGASSGGNYTWTTTAQYTESFERHNVEFLLGAEAYENWGSFRNGSIQGFFSFNPNFTNLNTGSGTPVVSSGEWEDTILSFFSRLDYIFDDKYILGFTLRRDGSSRFLNNPWGWFPAASVGWRISQENFMENITWLDDLRLFAGYGVMGNQVNVSPANSFTLFASDDATSFYAIDGSNSNTSEGFRLQRIGNPDAEWEKNINLNIGFDISMFNERVNASVEYYRKDIQDLLFNPQLPGTAGSALAPFVNIANMENQGLDLSLSTFSQLSDNLQINATLTLTTYQNEIKSIAEGVSNFSQESRRFVGNPIIRNEVGQPVSSFFGYKIDGFWNSEDEMAQANANAPSGQYQNGMALGRFRYADMTGDGEITPDDRTFLGDPNPDFTYGLNLGMNYKDFDVSMFWYGSQGNDIWNQVRWWTDFFPSFQGAKSNTALNDSWRPDNLNATAPIQENEGSFSTNGVPNSYYVEDGSYLRLRNLQVGYTLPRNILQRIGVGNLRVYVQGNNLVTFTGYSGPDPEIGFFTGSGAGGGSTNFGIDEGQYPTPKQILFGINLSI